jgi:hypothetical protein
MWIWYKIVHRIINVIILLKALHRTLVQFVFITAIVNNETNGIYVHYLFQDETMLRNKSIFFIKIKKVGCGKQPTATLPTLSSSERVN